MFSEILFSIPIKRSQLNMYNDISIIALRRCKMLTSDKHDKQWQRMIS